MSFMKKVAKVAAPFASLIPGIGPLIGGGLGLLGSMGGGGGKKGKVDPMQEQYMRLLSAQEGRATEAFGMGKPLVASGTDAMKAPMELWKNILMGGGEANRALAGPISDISTGYNQARSNTARFAPSGSAASAFADQGRMMARDMSRLKSDLLMGSADRLAGAGQGLITQGTGLMGVSQSGTNSALNAILGDRNLQAQRDLVSAQKWSGLGQGIGSLLGTLLRPGGILNKGNG
jgi:hypothetical protein